MKHIIVLSIFFCFASFSVSAFDLDGGAQLPSQSFDTGSNEMFGSKSSGGGVANATSSSGGVSSSGNSGSGGGGVLSGAFDWLARQTSSSYSTPMQRTLGDGDNDWENSLGPQDGGETSNKEEETLFNDTPVGGGAGALLMFSLIYLAVASYRKRKA